MKNAIYDTSRKKRKTVLRASQSKDNLCDEFRNNEELNSEFEKQVKHDYQKKPIENTLEMLPTTRKI